MQPCKGVITAVLFRPFRPRRVFCVFTRGDALASLALAPGYHISRLWRLFHTSSIPPILSNWFLRSVNLSRSVRPPGPAQVSENQA